jgi:hypothetical protein
MFPVLIGFAITPFLHVLRDEIIKENKNKKYILSLTCNCSAVHVSKSADLTLDI